MKQNFFNLELRYIQERFNQTFGRQTVCDLEFRCQVILAIVSMGMISKQIINTENKDKVREEIQLFLRTRKVLNNIFNRAENCWEERGRHDKSNQGNRRGYQRCIAR